MKFKRKGLFHVYIVQCIDGTYYTGSTKNLEERIEWHQRMLEAAGELKKAGDKE